VFLLERYIYTLDGKPLGAVAVLGITNLTTAQADPAALAAYVRGHWSIESCTGFVLLGFLSLLQDVAWGDTRTGFAADLRGCGARGW